MTVLAITGMGLTGVLRLTWVQDNLAHVLEHCESDEPSGTWTNSRVLHLPGEKPQVTRSRRCWNSVPDLRAAAF